MWRRHVAVLVLAPLLAVGCSGDEPEPPPAPAPKGHGPLGPAPFDAGTAPLVVGGTSQLYVIETRETIPITDRATRYSFETGAWTTIGSPPHLEQAALGWSGSVPVLLGLACREEASPCEDTAEADVIAAVFDPEEDRWNSVELGPTTSEKFGSEWIGTEDGNAYFTIGYDVLRVASDGSVVEAGAPAIIGAWQICAVDDAVMAVAPSPLAQNESLEQLGSPSLGNAALYRLGLKLDDEAWAEVPSSLMSGLADPSIGFATTCTNAGPLIISTAEGVTFSWNEVTWERGHAEPRTLSYYLPPLRTASGNPIFVYDNQINRVVLDSRNRPSAWKIELGAEGAEPLHVQVDVVAVDDRVVVYERSRAEGSVGRFRVADL